MPATGRFHHQRSGAAIARQGCAPAALVSAGAPVIRRSLAAVAALLCALSGGLAAQARDTLPLPEIGLASGQDAQGLRLTQRFTAPGVVVGETLTVHYLLENEGQARSDIVLEVYFLLENTSLVSAPGNCRRQPSTSGQEVLFCEIGQLAAGASHSLLVTVATTAESRPAVVASALVGELRVDSQVPVVRDTLTDSDGDGVSNFIEALRGTDPGNPASVDRRPARIDVLALYTGAAASLYPGEVENRINHFFNTANHAWHDSAVYLSLRPVHFEQIGYAIDSIGATSPHTLFEELLAGSTPAFAEVESLRHRYGADLVALFDSPRGGALCGLAPIGGFGAQGDFSDPLEKNFGYAWINIGCAEDLVLAHEFGHNMGLTHSHREDGFGGTFDFATGHGVDGEFATVMATPEQFGVPQRTPVFSNPDLSCGAHACGRPPGEHDDEAGANAAAALNIVAPQIEAWFESVLPELPSVEGRSLVDGVSVAHFGLGGQVNDELRHSATIRSGDTLRLVVEVKVDPEHIGMTGSFHVVVTSDSQQYQQIDRELGLTLWDGTIGDLRSATIDRELRPLERFHIVDNYQIPAYLNGSEVLIFLAYQVPGDIIYRPEPLRLRFID